MVGFPQNGLTSSIFEINRWFADNFYGVKSLNERIQLLSLK
jgi:hypothetical protein